METKHPISPTIRGAFLKALKKKSRQEGKTFSDLMLDEINEHGLLVVMEKVGKFVERSATVKHTGQVGHAHTHARLPETDALLTEVFSIGKDQPSEESSEVRPLLPH